jgi:hypothetical protein
LTDAHGALQKHVYNRVKAEKIAKSSENVDAAPEFSTKKNHEWHWRRFAANSISIEIHSSFTGG